MVLRYWEKEDEIWSERKVIINHALLNFPHKKTYTIADFYIPRIYPRSSIVENPADILKEILTYESIGIKIKNITLGLGILQLLKTLDEFNVSNQVEAIPFTIQQLNSLPEEGFSLVAPYIQFSLSTDQQKQARAEKIYLEKYVAGHFSSDRGVPILGYYFLEDLFEHVISRMLLIHGRNIQLDLLGFNKSKGSYVDQLMQSFSAFAPTEFSLWKSGKVQARFIEHFLVWVRLKKRLIIKYFDLFPQSGVGGKVYLKIPVRRPAERSFTKNGQKKKRISMVEVLENSDGITVYLNHDYYYPLTFRKGTKTSKLICALAKEGSIALSGLEKTYEYFFQFKRFPFFKKNRYLPGPLLEKLKDEGINGRREETYIIPHKQITFKMLTNFDIN